MNTQDCVTRLRAALEPALTDANRRAYHTARGQTGLPRAQERPSDPFPSEETIQQITGLLETTAHQPGTCRALRRLLGVAVDAWVGRRTRLLHAEVVRRERAALLDLDGRAVPYLEAPAVQAVAPSSRTRRHIEEAGIAFVRERVAPLYEEVSEIEADAARGLGWGSMLELRAYCRDIDLHDVEWVARELLRRTGGDGFVDAMKTLRLELDGDTTAVCRGDLAYFREAPWVWRPDCARRAKAVARGAFEQLTMNNTPPGMISVDDAGHSCKDFRARCIPVEVPGEIYVLTGSQARRTGFKDFLHEMTHALHFASVDASLAFEERFFIDDALMEGFAFLMDGLLSDTHWLDGRLPGDAQEMATIDRVDTRLAIRRNAATFLGALDTAQGATDPATLRDRHQARVARAIGFPWPAELYWVDVREPLTVAGHLTGWLVAAQLEARLRDEFGAEWFTTADAGRRIVGIWRRGGQMRSSEALPDRVALAEAIDAVVNHVRV